MPGLSTNSKNGKYREVLFWLLLLGSWQFLASPGRSNGIIGAVGEAVFLVYAWASLDQLGGRGLDAARWRSAARKDWMLAAVSGILAGTVVFVIGTASGQNMRLDTHWTLIALQVTLGPVLEEIVFRGYLLAFLTWLLNRVEKPLRVSGNPRGLPGSFMEIRGRNPRPNRVEDDASRNQLTVVLAAVIFAVVHLAQPGVSWLQLACITSTGTLYGWIRCRSGSTAPAAVSHALYNLALYTISGAVLLGENAQSSR